MPASILTQNKFFMLKSTACVGKYQQLTIKNECVHWLLHLLLIALLCVKKVTEYSQQNEQVSSFDALYKCA